MVRARGAPGRPAVGGDARERGAVARERGAVAVEFALLFPLLFFLLFGTIVAGWRLWERQAGQATAREAGRLAALGIDSSDAFRRAVVCFGESNGLTPGTLTGVQVAFRDSSLAPSSQAAVGGYVKVTLSYRSAMGTIPMITDSSGAFTSTGLTRVEQVGTIVTGQSLGVDGEKC